MSRLSEPSIFYFSDNVAADTMLSGKYGGATQRNIPLVPMPGTYHQRQESYRHEPDDDGDDETASELEHHQHQHHRHREDGENESYDDYDDTVIASDEPDHHENPRRDPPLSRSSHYGDSGISYSRNSFESEDSEPYPEEMLPRTSFLSAKSRYEMALKKNMSRASSASVASSNSSSYGGRVSNESQQTNETRDSQPSSSRISARVSSSLRDSSNTQRVYRDSDYEKDSAYSIKEMRAASSDGRYDASLPKKNDSRRSGREHSSSSYHKENGGQAPYHKENGGQAPYRSNPTKEEVEHRSIPRSNATRGVEHSSIPRSNPTREVEHQSIPICYAPYRSMQRSEDARSFRHSVPGHVQNKQVRKMERAESIRNNKAPPVVSKSYSYDGSISLSSQRTDQPMTIGRSLSHESSMGGSGYRTRTSGLTGREIGLNKDASSKDRSSLHSEIDEATSSSSTEQKIALFGGSGMTGKRFLQTALDAGYQVQCLPSDDPRDSGAKIAKPWKILQAEMEDTQLLETLVEGASFVVLMINDLLPRKNSEYPAHFLTRLVAKLYVLMKRQESTKVFLFQSTSLASDVSGQTPVFSKVVKKTTRRRDPFIHDLDAVMKKIAIEHCLRPATSKKKDKTQASNSDKQPEEVVAQVTDPPHFAFLVTRPTILLQNGPGCKRLFASKSQPGPVPISHVDLAEFSLTALTTSKLFNTSPYVVADCF